MSRIILLIAALASACGGTSDIEFTTGPTGKHLALVDGELPPPGFPGDSDGDSTAACGTEGWPAGWCDCDDTNPAINSRADEICDDIVDNDCDGLADDADNNERLTWVITRDGDSYGVLIDWNTDTGEGHEPEYGFFPGCDGRKTALASARALFGVTDVAVEDVPLVLAYRDPITGEPVLDCDDTMSNVFPGATEICDDLDNDCDGAVDDGPTDPGSFYLDRDGDGYGDPSVPMENCSAPEGYVTNNGDCDDWQALVNPDATDIPGDGVDQNCDGFDLCYVDGDGDGFGSGDPTSTTSCTAPGWSSNSDDCNDTQPGISPNQAEDACDLLDNDCDGLIDGADSSAFVGLRPWYEDSDRDGYGSASQFLASCDAPEGYVGDATDCDDTRFGINPGATEICDPSDFDEDCDGSSDDNDSEGAEGTTAWYLDLDHDGYGSSVLGRTSCEQPTETSPSNDDCNDAPAPSNGADIHPGAVDIANNGTDEDCDGEDLRVCNTRLRLHYVPTNPALVGSTDVHFFVQAITNGPGDLESYGEWIPGWPMGTEIEINPDGVSDLDLTTCLDNLSHYAVRVVHAGLTHCDAYPRGTNGQLYAFANDVMLSGEVIPDPVDNGCTQRIPLAP